MNVGLIIGLAVAGIGIVVAVIAVVMTLQGSRHSGGFGPSTRVFSGRQIGRSITLTPGYKRTDSWDSANEPASGDGGPTSPYDPEPPAGDPTAQSWARGDFGERRRTQRGGRVGALDPSRWIWYGILAILAIMAIAAAVTNGFGLAHPLSAMVGLFSGLIIIAVVYLIIAGRRRAADQASFAGQHGWQYARYDDTLLHRWYGPPFGFGCHPFVSGVISGESDGAPFTAFHYSYDTGGSGTNPGQTHSYSIIVRHLAQPLPGIQVTPASAFNRARHLGQDPFDEAWDVAMATDASAALLTSSSVKDWLMRPDHRGLTLRVEGSDLLTWQGGDLATQALPAALATLAEFANLITPTA